MATRTAYARTSLRYRLRNVKFIRDSVRFARRLTHLPAVIPSYAGKLGIFYGLRVFLVSGLSRGEILVEVPGISTPIKIRPRTSDKYCFEQIFLGNDYELPLLEDVHLIVDGGANVGYASIFFANNYPRASILAVEPEPFNFATLLSNIQPYPQIKAIRAAVWDKAERVVVDNSDESWAAFVTSADSVPVNQRSALSVLGLTIDDLLKISGATTIDILKLDIEGAEKELFSAANSSWLSKTRVLIVELHDRMVPGCGEALDKALDGYSFQRTIRGENTILIRNDPKN